MALAFIIVYFAIMMGIGIYSSRKVKGGDDMATAGRTARFFPTLCSKAAVQISGSETVGSSAYGMGQGITALWFNISKVLMAWVPICIVGRVNRIGRHYHITTSGQFFGQRYGSRLARMLNGICNTGAYLALTVAQVVATGSILAVVANVDYNLAVVVSTIVVMICTVLGGMHSILLTNIIQIIMIYVGIVFTAFPVIMGGIGNVGDIWAQLPEAFTQFGSMGAINIIVMILANSLGLFGLQANYTFNIVCDTPSVAKKASFACGFIYMIPAGICTFLGTLAFVIIPDVNANNSLATLVMNYCPPIIVAIFMAGIVAATLSSTSGFAMCATLPFVQDVYKNYLNPNADDKQIQKATQVVLLVIMAVAAVIAMFFQNIISIAMFAMTFASGALLCPALGAFFWRRATGTGAVVSTLVGGILHLFCTVSPIAGLPAFVISVPSSAIALIVVSLLTKPQDDAILDEWYSVSNGVTETSAAE